MNQRSKAAKEVTEKILIDTGASNDFIGNLYISHNYRHYKDPQRMENAGMADSSTIGEGDVTDALRRTLDQPL